MPVDHQMDSLKKILFRSSAIFLVQLLVSLTLSSMKYLYILNIKPFGQIICKYFHLFNRLSFHFVDDFLCCPKDFKFN